MFMRGERKMRRPRVPPTWPDKGGADRYTLNDYRRGIPPRVHRSNLATLEATGHESRSETLR
jgi:hypothetical protein